ncbi:GNAT family N-acetyltransferase [Pseudaestuariivita sp.]|uniref:GNAT family N-acetyltransferase n=1 Tax=Pseudaestuariivita sp. TaxID=2211669 RepID=UPI00405A4B99
MHIWLTQMTEAHTAEIAAIWHAGWHEAHAAIVPQTLTDLRTLENFTDRLAALIPHTRIAMTTAGPVGFVSLLKDEVYQVYVAPAARGTGAAAALMHDAEARLARLGATRAWLSCATGNTRGAAFYERAGWTRTREEDTPLATSAGPFMLRCWRYEKALDTPMPRL